jgi:hypothetical protein
VADVVARRPADEALLRDDPAAELRVAQFDPRVDHGDPDREELLGRVEDVEPAVAAEVPLALRERVVRQCDGGHGCRRRRKRCGGRAQRECAPHAGTTVRTGEMPAA